MNSNSILTSNLLDIIFENRNKDYGAYVLRKNYNVRLLKSLAIALSVAFLFTVVLMLTRKNSGHLNVIQPNIEVSMSPLPKTAKPLEPKKNMQSNLKQSKEQDIKALIVKDNLVEKEPPELPQAFTAGIESGDESPLEGAGIETVAPVEPPKPEPPVAKADKSRIDPSPDIPPQFPGGVTELLKFLKRNINTPEEIEAGQQIAVKVQFVVNYNGDLTGFQVIETGGKPFDNEVIKALKKMPKWIPGKTAGEDVSAYFVVPVKFTATE